MLAYLSMGPEGELYVNEGNSEEGNLIAELPAKVMIGLDLFNEGRPGFTWEGDGERAAEMLSWLLEDADQPVKDRVDFNARVRSLCTPGGSQRGGYVIDLLDPEGKLYIYIEQTDGGIDDGDIRHLEVFSERPKFPPRDNSALFNANVDGGDSRRIW